uniref:Exocyst subunit Exo70 family protein n=1 Tax=Anthurium amnicola TaxID=1678845 RepID=A0A1D1YJ64_9ARAE
MAAPADGDERVMATAQHIVKSLGTSKNATEDMLLILSTFDNRLSNISDLLSGGGGGGVARCGGRLGERLDAAEGVVFRWGDSSTSGPARGFIPWETSPEEGAEYLAAVDDVISLTEEAEGDEEAAGDAEVLDRAERVLQMTMDRLEEEFRHIMIQNTVPLDAARLYGSIRRMSISFASDAGDGGEAIEDFVSWEEEPEATLEERSVGGSLSKDLLGIDLVRPEAVPYLKSIAERMIRARYEKECCQAYSSVRRDLLDECLAILGVDKISIEEVQRIEWKDLDEKMKKWIHAVKVVVQALLIGEKQLTDLIFEVSPLIAEVCFTETAKGCVMQLLNFAEAVAIGQRSPEKLFRILDMYDALSNVLPDLQAQFPEEARGFLCNEAEIILKGLGVAARGTLAEFENAVQRETSRKPMQFGDIHPMTRYVMNYVKLLVDYSATLDGLIDESGTNTGDLPESKNDDENQCAGDMSPLGRHVLSTVSCMESNIEEKSKLYEDNGLQYIFLMNNILYLVQKVRDSELGVVLGDEWVRKRRGQIRQYARSYLRASWTKVLHCLKDEGIGFSGSSSSASKATLKERFKNFNMAFEEVYRNQIAWKVPDPQLREELRISISEKVIPAYRSFMGRFGSHLEGGRHAAKYIKYTAEDLENYLLDLFEGSSGHFNHSRRKLSS